MLAILDQFQQMRCQNWCTGSGKCICVHITITQSHNHAITQAMASLANLAKFQQVRCLKACIQTGNLIDACGRFIQSHNNIITQYYVWLCYLMYIIHAQMKFSTWIPVFRQFVCWNLAKLSKLVIICLIMRDCVII